MKEETTTQAVDSKDTQPKEITATRAADTARVNGVKLEHILKRIEEESRRGHVLILEDRYISQSVTRSLLDLGYMIGKAKDSLGVTLNVISWEHEL